jgi:hypothetical protein
MKKLIILFFVFLLIGGVKYRVLADPINNYPDTLFIQAEDFPSPYPNNPNGQIRDIAISSNGKVAILASWNNAIEIKDIIYIGRIKSDSFEVEKNITVTSGMFGVPKYSLDFFGGDIYLSGESGDGYVFRYSDKGLDEEIRVTEGHIDFLRSKYGKLWIVARDKNGREMLWHKEDKDSDWKSVRMPENYNISDITFDHYGNPWLLIIVGGNVYEGDAKVFEIIDDSLINRNYDLETAAPWIMWGSKITVDKHNHKIIADYDPNYRGVGYIILNEAEGKWLPYSIPVRSAEFEDFAALYSTVADSLNNLFIAYNGGLAKVIMKHTKDSFASPLNNADSLVFDTNEYFKYSWNIKYFPRLGDKSAVAITHPEQITFLLGKPVGPPPSPEIVDVSVDTLWNINKKTAEVRMSFQLETYPSFGLEYQVHETNSDSVFFGNLPAQTTELFGFNRTVVITTSGKPPLEYLVKFRTFDPAVNLYSDWTEETNITIEPPPPLPSRYRLYQNYPNPFNTETAIRYDLPQRTNVKLVVFNILGQKVKTLVNKKEEAGGYKVLWDGTDDLGRKAGSGVYFYQLKASKFVETKRMILLR